MSRLVNNSWSRNQIISFVAEILGSGSCDLEIVTVDENILRSLATELCLRIAQSSAFHLTALMPVLTDAMIAASKHYNLADEEGIERCKHILYSSQLRSKMILPLYALSEFFSKAEKLEH